MEHYLGKQGLIAIATKRCRKERTVGSKVELLSTLYSLRGSDEWAGTAFTFKILWYTKIAWQVFSLAYGRIGRYTADQLDVVSTVLLKVALSQKSFIRHLLLLRTGTLLSRGFERCGIEAEDHEKGERDLSVTKCLLSNTAAHWAWLRGWADSSLEYHGMAARAVSMVEDCNQRSRVYRGLMLQAARMNMTEAVCGYEREMEVAASAADDARTIWPDLRYKNNLAREEAERLLS